MYRVWRKGEADKMSFFNPDWKEVECGDCKYSGDHYVLFVQQMGFSGKLCSICHSHTRNGICLNACHLSKRLQEKFANEMKKLDLKR